MAAGGFCNLPDGNVVVALNLPGTPARGAESMLPVAGSGDVVGAVTGAATAVGPGSAAPAVSGAAFGVPSGAMSDVPAGAVPGDGAVRVLVLAANRARALTRLRNLGIRAIYLRGNAAPPTPDEITAVLHHPDGLIWRGSLACPAATAPELWHPIRALLRRRS
ncbi:hypothetical protein [Streptomyces sp. NBC_01314]|uniref:hypothetical protein n=1 Tax=Streptomyces sp. NBC_01314 TaxID=2903821 RepID=UPI00352CCDF1